MTKFSKQTILAQALVRLGKPNCRVKNPEGYVFFPHRVCKRYVLTINLGMHFVRKGMFQTLVTLCVAKCLDIQEVDEWIAES